jgi:hypothetical protein
VIAEGRRGKGSVGWSREGENMRLAVLSNRGWEWTLIPNFVGLARLECARGGIAANTVAMRRGVDDFIVVRAAPSRVEGCGFIAWRDLLVEAEGLRKRLGCGVCCNGERRFPGRKSCLRSCRLLARGGW